MVIEYVGAGYAGFQRQSNKTSVQGALERAILGVTGEAVTLAAAGRTDAGAHAFRQVATFHTSSLLAPDTLRDALNAHLPRDIAVTSVCDVPERFNPRFHALSRTYRYVILNRPVRSPFHEQRAWHIRSHLDVDAMNRAARELVGATHLGAFIPMRHAGSRVRTIFEARCERDGDLVAIELRASGFMKQMARSIVGTLVEVGLGRMDLDTFRAVVAARDRALAAPTAPAHGLYLVDVEYDTVSHHQSPDRSDPGGIEEKG